MTAVELAMLLEAKARAAGFAVQTEPSPRSDSRYVRLRHPAGWTAHVRVSDHDLAGGRRPLELRTTDPESAIDDLMASLVS